jgi:hypothetical protein
MVRPNNSHPHPPNHTIPLFLPKLKISNAASDEKEKGQDNFAN